METKGRGFQISSVYLDDNMVPADAFDCHKEVLACFLEVLCQPCPSGGAQLPCPQYPEIFFPLLTVPSGALKVDVIQIHILQNDLKISHQEKTAGLFSSLFLLLNSIKKKPPPTLSHCLLSSPLFRFIVVFSSFMLRWWYRILMRKCLF